MKNNTKTTDKLLTYIGFTGSDNNWLSMDIGNEIESKYIVMEAMDGGYICYIEGFEDRVKIGQIYYIHELRAIAKVVDGCDIIVSEINKYFNE